MNHGSGVLSASGGTREHRVNFYTGCAGGEGALAPARLAALAGRLAR